jgi:hypothetical protein
MHLRFLFITMLLLASACQAGALADTPTVNIQPDGSIAPMPSPTGKPLPTAEPIAASEEAVPQEITFQASDGQELHGRYYPAAKSPAPVVVLMHWVNGDMTDWNEIAPWLQNTGHKNTYPNCVDAAGKWWDPSWFPPVPADKSYGVFIFTFRDHEVCKGANSFKTAEWLLDAQAAIWKAAKFEGADPKRIVAIGSSIGADGAADACFWLNQQTPDSCQGALSLSPGGFLEVPYNEAVKALGGEEKPKAAWCLADPQEIAMCKMVADSANEKYRMIEIVNGGHGNLLLVPEAEPSSMQLILDFLVETVG